MNRRAAEADIAVRPKAEPALSYRIGLCAAAWAVPGLGHLMLGRRGRGLVLFGAIMAMFSFGLAMKGEFFSYHSSSILQMLGFFGELCVGLVMPAATFFGYSGGDPFFVSADYGTAFLVAAGMLNLLTVLDAHDIAVGRKP